MWTHIQSTLILQVIQHTRHHKHINRHTYTHIYTHTSPHTTTIEICYCITRLIPPFPSSIVSKKYSQTCKHTFCTLHHMISETPLPFLSLYLIQSDVNKSWMISNSGTTAKTQQLISVVQKRRECILRDQSICFVCSGKWNSFSPVCLVDQTPLEGSCLPAKRW